MSWVEISRNIPGAWEDIRGMGGIGYIGCHECHECHVREFLGKFLGLGGLEG